MLIPALGKKPFRKIKPFLRFCQLLLQVQHLILQCFETGRGVRRCGSWIGCDYARDLDGRKCENRGNRYECANCARIHGGLPIRDEGGSAPPNGLRLSCGPPAPQARKMTSTGHSDRGGASGPTASSAG